MLSIGSWGAERPRRSRERIPRHPGADSLPSIWRSINQDQSKGRSRRGGGRGALFGGPRRALPRAATLDENRTPAARDASPSRSDGGPRSGPRQERSPEQSSPAPDSRRLDPSRRPLFAARRLVTNHETSDLGRDVRQPQAVDELGRVAAVLQRRGAAALD